MTNASQTGDSNLIAEDATLESVERRKRISGRIGRSSPSFAPDPLRA